MILNRSQKQTRREGQPKLIYLAAVVSIMLILSLGGDGASPAKGATSPRIGFTAPDFDVKTLSGTEASLRDHLGSPVFINFFTTWCHFCRVEMPYIEDLHKELGDQVAFMIIDLRESQDVVESYFQSQGWTVPVYLDPTAAVGALYAVRGIPASFFIDGEGVIRDMVIGAMTEKRLQQGIESILP